LSIPLLHCESVGDIGPDAREAVPALTTMLQDNDWRVADVALEALGKIGADAQESLRQAMKSPNARTRSVAVQNYGKDVPDDVAIPLLVRFLDDPDPNVRENAAWKLGQRGAAAAAAVPKLIALLKDRYGSVALKAAQALGNIGPLAKGAVPALRDVLNSNRVGGDREYAIQALGRIGTEAKDAVADCVRIIPDRKMNPQLREYAIIAIGRIASNDSKSAIPALLELMRCDPQGQEMHLQVVAAETLGRFGPDAESAVPMLIEMLADLNFRVRMSAAIALGGIGPPARSAIPALEKALGDRYGAVQGEATKALERINVEERK